MTDGPSARDSRRDLNLQSITWSMCVSGVRAFESLPGSQFGSQQRRKLIDEQRREIRGVVKATVTSLVQKTHRIRRFPPQNCEVIQLARITGSDPVHARSNRALAAKFRTRSQSLAAGYLTVYQEGRVQLPLRPPQG